MEYTNILQNLKWRQVVEIFNYIDRQKLSNKPPMHPKNGSVYIFDKNKLVSNDYLIDRIPWKNNGTHKYPKKEPTYRKTEFRRKNKINNGYYGFRKYIFESLQPQHAYVLVHYLGHDDFEEEHTPQVNIKREWEETNVKREWEETQVDSKVNILDKAYEKMPKQHCNIYREMVPFESQNLFHEKTVFRAKEYFNILQNLKWSQVDEILSKIDKQKITNEPPLHPKNGSVFIFEKNKLTSKDYVADRISWKNNGTHKYPKGKPIYKKTEFRRKNKINNSYYDFRKYIFEDLLQRHSHILVHYLGNDDFDEEHIPLGNRRKDLEQPDSVSSKHLI